jgi:hypothetical protein
VVAENEQRQNGKLITKRRIWGSVLGVIGFMLSPLSWWNDAFVNLPLAIAFGWLVSLVYKPAFEPGVVVGYWLTNVLGFVMMYKGGAKIVSKEEKKYSKKDFLRDLGISLAYTLLIVVLIKFKVLQPIGDYFKH